MSHDTKRVNKSTSQTGTKKAGSKKKENTKSQVLNASEELFAEHGFEDTSMRAITGKAGVNLASVNYHFGSKKQLIQSVIARYVTRLMPDIDDELTQLLAKTRSPSVHQVFKTLVRPILGLNQVRPNGATIFVQLLGRGYTENQGHLRRYMTENFGHVLNRFVETLHLALPNLPAHDLFWRLHFVIGTVVFTMASSRALIDIAEADFQQQVDIENIIDQILPFVAAGVSAPAEVSLTAIHASEQSA